MAYSKGMGDTLGDYANLRSVPALMGIVFTMSSVYLFGGIEGLTISWGINYTLTTSHALWASIAVYVVAFASSETKQFASYEDWEKFLIAAGPLIMVGYEHVQYVTDLINNSAPELQIVAFVITFVGYGVAIR